MFGILIPEEDSALRVWQARLDSDQLAVVVASTASEALCPLCHLVSGHIHSHYQRTLLDLPVATHAVCLKLRVRRFFCRVSDCPRRIFAERVPTLARPYAHRTVRMATALRQVGLALGGRAGARLAADLQLVGSRDTLLRLVRSTEEQSVGHDPKVIGIDDWAKRKGQTYGTIICDLETGAVLDLLPDREAATVADWLKQRPGVEIISRDRAGAYAEAAHLGAPDARQVADRFHILKNLGEALEELLSRLFQELSQISEEQPAVAVALSQPASAAEQQDSQTLLAEIDEPSPTAAATSTPEIAPATRPAQAGRRARQRAAELSCARRDARLGRYEEVVRLHKLGWSHRAIADHLGMSRKTIGRWLSKGSFPEARYPTPRRSKLDEHKAYLQRRWAEGCHNARQLLDEIRAVGYKGGRTTVRDYLAGLRKEHKGSSGQGGRRDRRGPRSNKLARPRQLKWLLLRPASELSNEEYETVMKLCRCSKEVTLAYGLVMDFQDLVRGRKAEHLASWVGLALASGVEEIASFARGVLRDFAAVYAGLELEWSQGAVEGHVNRLKMLKRAMYGRASFDLLRLRVLYAH